MRRRSIRAALGLLPPLLLALGCGAPSPPSVVLVLVDTVRADRLSVYGSPRDTTPSLAARAERAAVFEHAFATSPWTVPSTASLLTGLTPRRHGAGYRTGKQHGFTVLPDDVPTLAGRLSEHGYETAAIVNNVFLGRGFGLHRGFARYDHSPAGDLDVRRADEVVESGLRWLAEPRTGPAFLLLHLMDPHIAYDPPPDVAGRFTADLPSQRFRLPVRLPKAIRRDPPSAEVDRRFLEAAYDEELVAVDRALERLLRELDGGALEGSVVMVTSDHGEEFFEHGGFEHGHALYQELLHVPLLVWGPGVRPGRYDEPVSLVDALPTVLDAVGAPPQDGVSGRSLWGLVTRGEALASRDLVAEALLHGPERRVLVRWPHKLDVKTGPGRVRLFDLEADPGERRNLAKERPELVATLRAALDAESREARESSLADVDEETREKLAGLGYVE